MHNGFDPRMVSVYMMSHLPLVTAYRAVLTANCWHCGPRGRGSEKVDVADVMKIAVCYASKVM